MEYDYEKGFADVLHLFADELQKAQGKSKRCSKCGQVKPVGEFYKHSGHRDGLSTNCRVCLAAYQAAYRAEHREERAAYSAAYRAEHREERRAYQEAHRDKYRVYQKTYQETHRDERKIYQKNYNEAYGKAYRETHREYYRARNARRAARKKALPHTLTPPEWELILEHYQHSCAYCGATEKEVGILHQEHVIPLSRGGGYTALNIVPACPSCNFKKYDKTPEEAGMKLSRIKLKQVEMF